MGVHRAGSLSAVAAPLRLDVPLDIEAVEAVRERVTDRAEEWGFADLSDLEVVTSELVTNAIVHAHSPSVVELRLVAPDCVEVSVADGAPEPPVKRVPYDQHTRGLGLHIVDALSSAWGVRPADSSAGEAGKVVWARLGG